LVNGQLTKTLGAISMDMLAVDITELQDVDVGAQVELWGSGIHVSEVAQYSHMSPYELLCNVKRVDCRHVHGM
jgi:alanine racemase